MKSRKKKVNKKMSVNILGSTGPMGPDAVGLALSVEDPLVMALAIIGVVLLIIIILFLSYFNILRSIASYSYSNARFKAVGTPYVQRHELELLADSQSLMELSQKLGEKDMRIPQSQRISVEEFEDAVKGETIRMLRNTLAAVPEGSKPFFRAYMTRMDATQVKTALRAVRSGEKLVIHPAYHIDAEKARLLASASTPQEIAEIAGAGVVGNALSEALQQYPDDPVGWEMHLDKVVFDSLYSSLALVEDEIKAPFKEFYGRYADVMNIKLLARLKGFGIKLDNPGNMIVNGGRELPKWAVERLMDSADYPSLMSDLENTTYGQYLKDHGGPAPTPSQVEHILEQYLISAVVEISSRNTLLGGPSIKFAYCKEVEARNLMALARAVAENVPFPNIEQYLTLEVGA
ncbi:MAG: V-type ATPase subunit [Candidatus Thermoplasmatota archaeon]|nr:V-type ATPase subunit [Candidatus Thermoplasmatota archaeon]